ncbi:PREDICTED: proline synthase co-transcribed bacterial homolog protein [Nicrophorus vespilloides]|uniref:Pyridoxal phosphate homeostasis protein n=1 Tax=Nicrophorus vespilloides TaxID=110193 RepID=A0ABM1M965_NICVS|nr:PREDICTED: proline synthase co-transcribed bacterial homolog protein [Nicrophorus vespilloides]
MLKTMMDVDVKQGLRIVRNRIEAACQKRKPELQNVKANLVAVSKTKPAEMIVDCYDEGQRDFGENYVKELSEKGINEEILSKCKEIRWHFIGHLQNNKVNKLLKTPNLYMIETVDSVELADLLNKNWQKIRTESDHRMKIMIQVNTSGEQEKSGADPGTVNGFGTHVIEKCPNLELVGLMTIGRFGYNWRDEGAPPNPDFLGLIECRAALCDHLGIDHVAMELSMGMSDDFEHAIDLGSGNVRVGSSIFGHRNYNDK